MYLLKIIMKLRTSKITVIIWKYYINKPNSDACLNLFFLLSGLLLVKSLRNLLFLRSVLTWGMWWIASGFFSCRNVGSAICSFEEAPEYWLTWFFVKLKHKKWYIYYIYDFRRAIYNDIAASTSVLYRPRQKKKPSGRAVPSGLRPSGTALPSGFFLPRTKKNLAVGAISLYIALQK